MSASIEGSRRGPSHAPPRTGRAKAVDEGVGDKLDTVYRFASILEERGAIKIDDMVYKIDRVIVMQGPVSLTGLNNYVKCVPRDACRAYVEPGRSLGRVIPREDGIAVAVNIYPDETVAYVVY